MRPGHGGGGPDGLSHFRRPHHRQDPGGGRQRVSGPGVFQHGAPAGRPAQGDVCVFFGKVEDNLRRKQMINPLFEPEGRQQVTGRIMPIYPLTAGVTQGLMVRAARQGLDACRELLPDVLPDEVRQAHKLCYVNYAYENIHFPASPEALEVARRRLVFEELFLLTCGLQLLRQRRRDVAGPACPTDEHGAFYRRLPFALTGAQRRAIADAVGDMVSGKPMNRLCQGDVGSGKTMVAAACIWFAVENGWQTALMAPTEILARQHYQGLGAAAGPVFHPVRPADRVHPGQGAAGDFSGAGGRVHRPVHRHPRPADGGRAVPEVGPGGDGRAAPVRREPAGGPVPEGGGSPYAGAVRHAHPPDPGPGDLRRPGRVGDR